MDDLLELWKGVSLSPDGDQCVRAALITVAADLPAIRKVTQFLGHKADLGCSRCKFRAEREPGTAGASGKMSYYTPSACEARKHEEVTLQAAEFRSAQTRASAVQISQKNGVRYSELIRLPYFDIVRMTTIDPMHTFLLGMVKRETELNLDMLTPAKRCELNRRLKKIRLPYNIGRLPDNIFDKERVNGVTAAQWKTYIISCARPCMYKLLPERAYRCLVMLSEIVTLIALPIFTTDLIISLYRLLSDHHRMFCQIYGKWAVTVNYHMSLHLPDMILDFGPPHSFWCFAYERFNGILAGTPNSNRCVEIEVANRFMRDFLFSSTDLPDVDACIPRSLKDLISASSVDDTQVPSYPLTFWVLSALTPTPEERFEHQCMVDRGDVDEDWPVELYHPFKPNVRMQLEFYGELKKFMENLYGNDLQYIKPRMNKYGRCHVNGQDFSSHFNSTDRGSIVKAIFVLDEHELAPYYGIVKFYFTVTAVVRGEPKLHYLSYVTWLKFKTSRPEEMSKLYMVSKDCYRSDRILSPRRFICRCVLVSPRANEAFYFVSELPK